MLGNSWMQCEVQEHGGYMEMAEIQFRHYATSLNLFSSFYRKSQEIKPTL